LFFFLLLFHNLHFTLQLRSPPRSTR
jgi:hypothetical protein